MKFDAPQDQPFTGWELKLHNKHCRVSIDACIDLSSAGLLQIYQKDIHDFGIKGTSLPPSCLVSVYGSPNAVPTLHYAVPLVGVAEPVTLYIQGASEMSLEGI